MNHWRRYWRMLGAMSALAVLIAAATLFYLNARGTPLPLPAVLAIGLGLTLTLVVAAALMGLVFLSHRSGHDARADSRDEA